MKQAAEFCIFMLLAGAAHLAIALYAPAPKGVQAAGSEGMSVVSLQAASGTIADLVDAWERPPDLTVELDTPDTPQLVISNAQLPRARADTSPMREPPETLGLAIPRLEGLPESSVTSNPPPTPRPKVSDAQSDAGIAKLADIRPVARPKTLSRQAPAKTPRRQKKPKTAAAASANQKASGQGGGAHAGVSRQQRPATLSAGELQSLTAKWGTQVRRKIERGKRYPSSARGASGAVTVRITVGRDGSLESVSIAGSSGHPALDKAALRAVRAARRFPSAPRGLNKPSYTFKLQINFSG